MHYNYFVSIWAYFNWICMIMVPIVFLKFYGRRYELVVHYEISFSLNGNGSFPFYIAFYFFPLSSTRLLQDLARSNNAGVYKKQEMLTLREHSFLCCFCFVLFLSLSFVLCPLLAVCGLSILECPIWFSLTFIYPFQHLFKANYKPDKWSCVALCQ